MLTFYDSIRPSLNDIAQVIPDGSFLNCKANPSIVLLSVFVFLFFFFFFSVFEKSRFVVASLASKPDIESETNLENLSEKLICSSGFPSTCDVHCSQEPIICFFILTVGTYLNQMNTPTCMRSDH